MSSGFLRTNVSLVNGGDFGTIPAEMDISVWQDNGAMQSAVGDAIRKRRKAKGWDQKTLGQRAGGVNKSTVNRIELGGNATVDKLLQISRALGADLELNLVDRKTGERQSIRDEPPPVSTDVSSPVTPLGESERAPGKDLADVSPTHKALFGILAALPVDLINDLLTTAADRLAKYNARSRESATEGDSRRQHNSA